MCDPISMGTILAIVGAGSAMMSVQAQNQQADAMAESATEALAQDYQITNRRYTEVNEKHALDAFERQRMGLKERAKLAVAMGESGVLGNSPLREINDSFLQEGYDKSTIESNRETEVNRTQDMALQSYTTAKGRLNQAKSTAVNPFMAILKIGLGGATGYLSGSAMGSALFPAGSAGGVQNVAQTNALGEIYRH